MLRVKRSVIAVFSNTYFNTEVLRQATQDSLNSVNQAINKVGSASSEASVGVREEGGGKTRVRSSLFSMSWFDVC